MIKLAIKLAKKLFQKPSLEERIKNNRTVKKIIEENPETKNHLETAINETIKENKGLIHASNFSDNWGRITAPFVTLVDYITLDGIVGAIPYLAANTIKSLGKIPGIAAYGIKTGNYSQGIKDLAYEIASYTPLVGKLLDIPARHYNRSREYIEMQAVQRFVKKLSLEEYILKAA